MGFGQGLSGLKGAAQKLDVIGNNIANSATVGFKSSTVSFADVYASSRVGLGTQVAAVNQNFGVGTISNTGGQFDMAIDGDRGLFRVVDSSGQVMYTRNGEFSVSPEGYLTNPQGYFLTAFIGESTTPERVRVPYGNIDPVATSTVDLSANFDANAPVVPSGALETRGWIDLTDAGGITTRYYYKVKGDAAELYDAQGRPAVIAGGAYTSGDEPITVVEGDPGDPPTIDGLAFLESDDAVFSKTTFPTGGEKIGRLVDDSDPDPANHVTYFYRVADNEFVWLDENGDPADPGDIPDGSFTSGGVPLTFVNGQLAGGGTTFPEGTNVDPYTPEQVPFDPLIPSTFTHSLPITVYDSLGNSHQLTQYFVKREAEAGVSVWSVYYRLNGQPIDNSVLDGTTELRFDKAGKLLEPIQPVAIEFSLAAGGSPAETLQISVDYAGSTQFGGGFTPDYLQNGYATGEYAALNFAADGSIVASYTNGKTIKTGTITLAHFNNLQGLRPVGGNAWIETSESGPAILGTPGSMGFSTIKGQALEDSNVDIGNELVNMIITQRIYQANAQTISTQNEMMQTLINMR